MRWMVNNSRLSTLKSGFILGLALFTIANCHGAAEEGRNTAGSNDQFKAYWYTGKAELTRYALEQARYGEIHKGNAVLIFVTEDFLTDKQVKKDFGNSKNYASVLKLNFTKKFYTGVYPYSMMVSVFTPVETRDHPKTLKITSSNQEWCGQTFTQLNLRDGKYRGSLRSYFQDEGDREFDLNAALLEDEVWTRIRLSPQSLPTGEIEIIPGLSFARLRHVEQKVEKAAANLTDLTDESLSENDLQVYAIDYKDLERRLAIKFEKEFPHRIVAWEETNLSGFGKNAQLMTTRAVSTNSIKLDYWTKNSVADSTYRRQLGLE